MSSPTIPGLSAHSHLPGFADPVHDAQRTFRAVLDAMARPTLAQPVPAASDADAVRPPLPLGAVTAAVLLTLSDEQTPIWLDDTLRASQEVTSWLRFHTGARLVDDPRDAVYAVASSPAAAPSLDELTQGTDEDPHLSATLVIDASDAPPLGELVAAGCGVNGSVDWDGAGLPDGFLDQWHANRRRFPRGVDLILATGTAVRALPRTTDLHLKEGNA